MGHFKELWQDLQQEDRDEWIRNRLDNDESDEYAEEWQELSRKYDDWMEHLLETAQIDEDFDWYRNQAYSSIYEQFQIEISRLKLIIGQNYNYDEELTFCKMVFAHAVTLLETYLGDSVKYLVLSEEKYLKNAINKIDELKKAKFSLIDIHYQKDGVQGFVLIELSKVMYHNISKVKRILESIIDTPLEIDISMVGYIASVRHDIVHRNGRSIDGESIDLHPELVNEAISGIESFAKQLQFKINEAITA
ncbi:hypothetical protein [Methylophaga pinxianii]|uniref:hypothetical protein n=1 Tax=Methylophaga pinxianii TaxID=2881052 RepID=UPI001CF1FF0F|nr:hypothetical protein [Methylophaga pinxianii]MCB2426903.1 hypothetical protein [Methylophaga pinxianii]UPH45667.1 hypothetical protein LGT42_014355 [Methylophaga pinxianii]